MGRSHTRDLDAVYPNTPHHETAAAKMFEAPAVYLYHTLKGSLTTREMAKLLKGFSADADM